MISSRRPKIGMQNEIQTDFEELHTGDDYFFKIDIITQPFPIIGVLAGRDGALGHVTVTGG